MKKSDMELKAIREKIQSLQAEPPAVDIMAAPWSAPKGSLEPVSTARRAKTALSKTSAPTKADISTKGRRVSRPTEAVNNNRAIETLQQRANSKEQAMDARAEHLIAQEIYRLEVQANNINERSHQQSIEIAALKRSAQQAAVALRRHGIHKHPKLAAITQFFEAYQSAVVPHIEKDNRGHFTLTYDTIDFHQAERDAKETAQSLRQRTPKPLPFVHPIAPGPAARALDNDHHDDFAPHDLENNRQNKWQQNWLSFFKTKLSLLLWRGRRHRPESTVEQEMNYLEEDTETIFETALLDPELEEEYGPRRPLSWIDGTIWFSGGAIIQIAVAMAGASSPFLVNLLWLGIALILTFALYQVVFSKSSDYSIVYRLLIAMLGLLATGFLF